MKRSCCSSSRTEKQNYQKVYCGTCKSIASTYGHKARMLLNYDAVFLAEILASVSDSNQGNNSISAFRCFDIPDNHEIPNNLKYAANVNVLFASLKSLDAVNDEGGFFAKSFHRIMKKESATAFDYFDNIGVSKAYFIDMLNEQNRREKLEDDLMFYAEPTMKMTSLIFALGTEQIDRGDLKTAFANLGTSFGELIYFLDAYEDFDKDIKRKQFNAFRSANGIVKDERRMEEVILNALKSVEMAINKMPLSKKDRDTFISRLHVNVNGVLYKISCKTEVSDEKIAEAKTIRLGTRWNAVASVIAVIILSTQGIWGQSTYLVSSNSKIESYSLTQWLVSIIGLGWIGLIIYIFNKKKVYQKIKKYRLTQISDPEKKEKKEKKPWGIGKIIGVVCGSICALCGLTCVLALAQDCGSCDGCGACDNADCCGDCDCGDCDCDCNC